MLTRTNRIRPTLDALEAREVCATAVQLNTITEVVPVLIGHVGEIGPVHKPTPTRQVADSVVTLRNATAHALTFTVRWEGAATAETYQLLPGQVRSVWVREAGKVPVGRTAAISVTDDRGTTSTFTVTAAVVPDRGTGPAGKGRVYTFREVRGELTLVPPPAPAPPGPRTAPAW